MSHIDADIEAIRELQARIERLWGNLAIPSREDLRARLDLLCAAADQRATDSRSVREVLQEVLLSIGTGALAVLSKPTRQRLTALTGIALPGHLPTHVAGRKSAAEMPGKAGRKLSATQDPTDTVACTKKLHDVPDHTAPKGTGSNDSNKSP